MSKLCVFAGTSEGRRLVEMLAGRGPEITACVATDYGETLLGEHSGVCVRAGRMDAADMATFFTGERFDLIVDATHPYAAQVTRNIFEVCARLGMPCLRLLRDSGAADGDGAFVPDAASCAQFLSRTEGNILLTTGSKDLSAFCVQPELRGRIFARVLPMEASLRICADCGIQPDHILAMQGPFDEEMNLAMLRTTRARWLVTKDSGSAGGYEAKLRAARRAGAKVVVIGRPVQHEGMSLADALAEIEARFDLAPLKKRVVLAGIGMGDLDSQTLGLRRAVEEADCIIGARRMLQTLCRSGSESARGSGAGPQTQPETFEFNGKPCFGSIAPEEIAHIVRREPYRCFAVLLSGDTGFYSGARRLIDEMRDVELTVLPGVSSLQYFCAKLCRSWEDVRALSLHGRDCDLEREVLEHPAVFALVGGEDGARRALARLRDAGLGDCAAFVGERLSYPDECIRRGSVAELAQGHFDPLSVLLVENENWSRVPEIRGLPDDSFLRGDVPMTKSEVRAVILSKLALAPGSIVYDVGTGSGSVAVEAARIARCGRVYAIERRAEALALARRNVEKFRLRNVEFIAGSAPEALSELPAPTHAFIGGSGRELRGILSCVLAKNPAARIVATAVTLETLSELIRLREEFEQSDVTLLSVSKPRILGNSTLMTAQNPVYIFTLQHCKRNGGGEAKQ